MCLTVTCLVSNTNSKQIALLSHYSSLTQWWIWYCRITAGSEGFKIWWEMWDTLAWSCYPHDHRTGEDVHIRAVRLPNTPDCPDTVQTRYLKLKNHDPDTGLAKKNKKYFSGWSDRKNIVADSRANKHLKKNINSCSAAVQFSGSSFKAYPIMSSYIGYITEWIWLDQRQAIYLDTFISKGDFFFPVSDLDSFWSD